MAASSPQTELITGASSGIGYEFAQLFARDGINLVLMARREPLLAELKTDLERQYGIQVTYLAVDLAAPGQVAAVYQHCQDQQVMVDYLVNNAGYGSYKDIAQEDARMYEDMLALNVVALTMLSALVAREMVARQRGIILNVGSTSAYSVVLTVA